MLLTTQEPEAFVFNLGNLKLEAPAKRARSIGDHHLLGMTSDKLKREMLKDDLKFRLDVKDTNIFSCKLGGDLQKSFILENAHISVSMVNTDLTQMLHIDTNDNALGLNITTRVCNSTTNLFQWFYSIH